ncbi:LysE family transporter [Candidatus Pelagibacter ubique]|uniref:LysE/ArgO family amino acid transporter n=1 Tax=Pelagibacter ubique TaxID=198252 RepID=UPI0003D1C5D8
MEYLVLGFFTGISLILAIGAQNIFVIEQGLKKQYVFLICLICALSDLILIFLGIFLFHYFNQYFNETIELIFNLLLIIFLLHFIYTKIKSRNENINLNEQTNSISALKIFLKTLGFTYLNPHVYSDTVFFLGNFSKNFILSQKIMFGIGASLASLLFFFSIGYASNYFSKYLNDQKMWKIINWIIITIMTVISLYVLKEVINSI